MALVPVAYSQRDLLARLDPALQEALVLCASNTKALGTLFMEDAFNRPFSPPHDQMFDCFDGPHRLGLLLAPRGAGKTTITRAYLMRNILFGLKKHIVYVSKSFEHSKRQTENLKWSLMSNPMFVKLFGSIESDHFATDSWVTSGGTIVIPKGSGQQIRGLLYKNWRPDLIIVDDLEDSELVLNPDYRDKQWEWFLTDLLESTSGMGQQDWHIRVTGTMLHESSVLAKLLKLENWHRENLPIWNEKQESLFPTYKTTAEIKEKFNELHALGKADLFAREFMGQPISRENASFSTQYFQYYNESDEMLWHMPSVQTVVIVDPAKTVKPDSDFTAVVVVGVDTFNQRIYVRDIVNARMMPDKTYETVLALMLKYNSNVVGLEVTSLNEYILQPFKNFMSSKMHGFELVELKPRGQAKKENRIAALLPYYRQKQVWHNATGVCQVLEDQLTSFPRSEYDDVMDALAYVVQMMELGGRYFQPSGFTESDNEAVFAKLEAEDSLEDLIDDEWMVA